MVSIYAEHASRTSTVLIYLSACVTGMTDAATPSLAAIWMRQTAETTADAKAIPDAATLIAAAVIVTGTAPLATVSATGS